MIKHFRVPWDDIQRSNCHEAGKEASGRVIATEDDLPEGSLRVRLGDQRCFSYEGSILLESGPVFICRFSGEVLEVIADVIRPL